MNDPIIQLAKTTYFGKNSPKRCPLRRGFLSIGLALTLAWLAPLPMTHAVSPPPDGGYPNENTAEGHDSLLSLTSGKDNTALGDDALQANTIGSRNTATGTNALKRNDGFENTANGAGALTSNTTGDDNTANGVNALFSNTSGGSNTANGAEALFNNRFGQANTANGLGALYSNTDGGFNTASGVAALGSNTTGGDNTATGLNALVSNTTGNFNTANGVEALVRNTTGSNNIALGISAGSNLTTGSNNIDIASVGRRGEANTIRIGKQGTQTATFITGISGATVAGGVGVVIDANGHLGTVTSSERFKDAIKPMDKTSEAILALKPVTFRYKHELDPEGIPQFGLVAEQVEKVNPDLVARDDQGKIYTVRYEAVNAMLLNEFLKEHRKVEEQNCKVEDQGRKEREDEATISQLKSTVAQQQKDFQSSVAQQEKEIKALTASLKEQASQIQKVSDQLEVSRPAPQLVVNNQ